MRKISIILVVWAPLVVHAQLQRPVDYNRVVNWQRRTLYCAPSPDGFHSGTCYLTVGKTEENIPVAAQCYDEDYFDKNRGAMDKRTLCNISCERADRDSVISKTPNSNRQCIRYHSYNTQQDGDHWLLWRTGACRLVEISLEVHCGFPN